MHSKFGQGNVVPERLFLKATWMRETGILYSECSPGQRAFGAPPLKGLRPSPPFSTARQVLELCVFPDPTPPESTPHSPTRNTLRIPTCLSNLKASGGSGGLPLPWAGGCQHSVVDFVHATWICSDSPRLDDVSIRRLYAC
jgi:hypothetical protein